MDREEGKYIEMDQILILLVSGITISCIYAIVALGFVVVYSITRVFNLSAGSFFVLGGMLASSIHNFGLPLFFSILLALIGNCLIAAILWLLFFHHPYSSRESPFTLLLIMATLSLVITGLTFIIWGTAPIALPEFSHVKLNLVGISLSPQAPWIWGGALFAIGLLYLFFDFTLIGEAFRACADRRVAARLMGINPNLMAWLSFILAALLSGIAGILSAPLTMLSYTMGLGLSIKGCLAAMLGGLDRPHGAIVGGLILGLVESFAGGFISTEFMEVISLGCLMIILLFIPEGIFGIKEEKYCRV